MLSPTRIAAVVAVLVVLAAVPAAASAGTVPMRGVVSGSPYGASNAQMAIPVLFSKMTVRSAGLKSPVGVIILRRTQKVALPGGGTSLPVNLRTGDRFKGYGPVSDTNKRTFYPRVPLTSKPQVYFRSKEMSLAELTAATEALRKAVADLQGQLVALQKYTYAGFQDLYTQLADIKKALAALKIPAGVDLTSIQSQIDALSKKVDDLIASLPDFSKFALLTDLTQYAKLTDLSAAIAGLQTQINALPTDADVAAAVSAGVAPVKTKVNEIVGSVNAVCTAIKSLIPATACTTVAPLP
jgi:hypothetical protein